MCAHELPTEILQDIFRLLPGFNVIQCRAVCSLWREAVDSLSDAQWRQICFNDLSLRAHYFKTRARHGLSWYETFRAHNSWSQVASAEITTHKLCVNTEWFIVRPGGIVGCFQRTKETDDPTDVSLSMCDTVVYYDTASGKELERQQHEFLFRPRLFFENMYLQALVLKDSRICIIVKQTKAKHFVGSLEILCEMTLIGKCVYFKNGPDQKIYESKLTEDNTLKTKCLEAFEAFDNFEEMIIFFIKKRGRLQFLTSSEFCSRAEVYEHKDGDIECVSDLGSSKTDHEYFFGLLEDEGFDWRCPAIYEWIWEVTRVRPKHRPFFANQTIILSLPNNQKAINIHMYPHFIPGINVLCMYLKNKPLRQIELTNDILGSIDCSELLKIVYKLDVIETPTSHKVLATIHKTLFVFEIKPGTNNTSPLQDEYEPVKKNMKKLPKSKTPTFLAKKMNIKKT